MSTFPDLKLNDKRRTPGIGFGTWRIGNGDTAEHTLTQAFDAGFLHFDSAQAYRNEEDLGEVLRSRGLKRDDVWITTKFSGGGANGLGIYDSCVESLKKLGLDSLDLYLIHDPSLCKGDIPGTWAQMERLKKDGLVKSIGVSNFAIADLEELIASASIVPAVNQVQFHPYLWAEQKKLMEFQAKYGIVTEAWSPLIPLTLVPKGRVTKAAKKVAKKLDVEPEQVLIAWAKSKGAVVLTMSRTKARVERYLASGSIELDADDVEALEKAGEVNEVPPWLDLDPPSSDEQLPPYTPPASSSPTSPRTIRFAEKLSIKVVEPEYDADGEYDSQYEDEEDDEDEDLEAQNTSLSRSSRRSRTRSGSTLAKVMRRTLGTTLCLLTLYVIYHASCIVLMMEERRESAY